MKSWTRWIGVSALLLVLSGCGIDAKSLGMGRRPYLPYMQALGAELTEGQKQSLLKMREIDPKLFEILQRRNNAYAEVTTQYMKDAVAVNVKQLVAIGYSEREAKDHVAFDLQKMGYPEDCELMKDLRK